MNVVFYSWQSDTSKKINNRFIQNCLEDVIKDFRSTSLDVRLDHDTNGVAGSPDIVDTILDKINKCSVFVADVSFINKKCDIHKNMPNPNVMFELGFAVKTLGADRIICIANTAYGSIEELPFDIRQKRVLAYSLEADADNIQLKKVQKDLSAKLKNAIKKIIDLPTPNIKLNVKNGTITSTLIETKNCLIKGDPDNLPKTIELFNSPFSTRISSNYYKELFKHDFYDNFCKKFEFVITNTGTGLVNNVRLEFEIPPHLIVESKLPPKPKESFIDHKEFKLPSFCISINDLRNVEIKLGNIQAKQTIVSESLYIGGYNNQFEIKCLIYSDEFSEPMNSSVFIKFETDEKQFSF